MKRFSYLMAALFIMLCVTYRSWFLEGRGMLQTSEEIRGRWHQTEGRVIRSGVRDLSPGLKAELLPDLVVTYDVDGERFENRRPWLGSDEPWRRPRRDRLSNRMLNGRDPEVHVKTHYPMGRTVTVHYDPVRPWESILEADAPPKVRNRYRAYLLALGAEAVYLLFLALSALGILKGPGSRQKPER